MKERIIQLGFDKETLEIVSQDVTPEGFTGMAFPTIKPQEPLSRFVREVKYGTQITSPAVAADYLMQHIYTPIEAFDQEEMWLLLLNIKGRITHEVMLYRGTVNSAFIRVAEIMKEAIRVNAPSIILSHCHPSGDPTPSPEDIAITKQANEAAELLNLEILDHIIVGRERWVSLKERKLGFD